MLRNKDISKLTALERNMYEAAGGGMNILDLQRWSGAALQIKAGEETYPRGLEYDAKLNVIRINGVITDDRTAYWMDYAGVASPGMLRDELAKVKPGWMLEINSPGGNVMDAAAMISAVQQNKPAASVVTGLAASAAAMLLLAADERFAGSELSMIMYHAPWTYADGNATDLQAAVDTLRTIEKSFADFVNARVTDVAAKAIIAAFDSGDDLYLTPVDAQEMGLIKGMLPDADGGSDPEPKPVDDEDADIEAKNQARWAEIQAKLKTL